MAPSPLQISLITAATAFVASVMGPIVTLAVARRQYRATVISTNRQRWIDTFRDRVSELVSLINAAQLIKRHEATTWRGGVGAAARHGVGDKFEKAFMALAEIRLLTIDTDPHHQRLNRALDTALAHLLHEEMREAELAASIEEVVSLSRAMIRLEWGRVKKGV